MFTFYNLLPTYRKKEAGMIQLWLIENRRIPFSRTIRQA